MTSPAVPATDAASAVACTHCGLPVPPALRRDTAADAPLEQFCCAGCRTVYAVIHGEGLDRFYELRERQGATGGGPAPVPGARTYQEFDDPDFHSLYCRPLPGGLLSVSLYVDAIHCAACVWLLERVAGLIDGVAEIRVDLGRSRIRVDWDPSAVQLSTVAQRLDSFGYGAEAPRSDQRDEQVRREDRALLVKIAVTGAVAGNVMLIAFALYGGAFHGMESGFASLFRWASLLLTIPAVAYGGSVFLRGAWHALRARVLHMDLPISIGIVAGFCGGAINTIRGTGEIYFDSVTALIFLLLVGRFLQRRQQRRAAEASQLLYSLSPRRARRCGPDGVVEVPCESLAIGDEVEVRAGDVVPADGVVVAGQSNLDVALLTGESRPVATRPGDSVLAGTVNLSAALRVRVELSGERTRVGQLLQLVEEYSQRRPRVVRVADRVAGWFVSIVLLLAGGTALYWGWAAPEFALDHTIALLVVTCPCALGLATPLAVAAAMGQAARAQLLVKGGDVFETLCQPGWLWLDKTGTLTEGRSRLLSWSGDDEARSAAVALERQSSHPLAVALVRDLTDGPASAYTSPTGLDDADSEVTNVEQVFGGGITGQWRGQHVVVGSPAFVSATVPGISAQQGEQDQAVVAAVTAGHTPVVVAIDGAVRGVAALGDALRTAAVSTVAELQECGWRVGILSGDHEEVVRAVGGQLGLDPGVCRGGLSPEGKLEVIEDLNRAGETTVMVGDGVNDSAALAAASVGVAIHGGAEAALTAADAYLVDGDIAGVAELLRGSSRTFRVIRRNLAFSLCYNVVGASLAVVGLVHPLVAAVLMPVSSLTVIVSSYRATLFAAPGATTSQQLDPQHLDPQQLDPGQRHTSRSGGVAAGDGAAVPLGADVGTSGPGIGTEGAR